MKGKKILPKNKAVFLDRDGTINIDKSYLFKSEDFEFLPGVKEALKLLQDAGFLLVVVTNQSGIARGYYTEKDFLSLDKWMHETLEKDGIHVSKTYYCPHLPDSEIPEYRISCRCRKPLTALFEQAAEEFCIDLDKSYAVGDRDRDVSLCKNTQTRGFVVYSSEERSDFEGRVRYISGGLLAAAKIILNENS